MKIGDQRERPLKDLIVRKVLKDNKVPGTRDRDRAVQGPRAAEAPAQVQGLLQESWERARLSCEQPGACLDQGGLNRKNFWKRKRKYRRSAAS